MRERRDQLIKRLFRVAYGHGADEKKKACKTAAYALLYWATARHARGMYLEVMRGLR